MIILGALMTFFYAGLILFLLFGFGKIPDYEAREAKVFRRFSIVIPFRNEAENLQQLFQSLSQLKYQKGHFEIIFVNDASEDNSVVLCENFRRHNPEINIQIIDSVRRWGAPKKDAITTAVEMAKNEYILTTDADCSVPENWLLEFNSFIEEFKCRMIAAPVKIGKMGRQKEGFTRIFQEIDFLSLQGATIGGFGVEKPFMCNGANLCYEKYAFKEVNGFSGNENIASGDDLFLLEKFQKEGFKTEFLKSNRAVVSTLAQPGFKSLFFQRIRWAAKTSAYNNLFGKFIAITVFLMNLLIVTGALAVISGYFPKDISLLFFLIKFNVDFVIIYRTSVFFGTENVLKNYFWCSFIYPVFSCLVAFFSLFLKFEWKGRSFKK
ncbi:glycosyltransferase [Salinimicrobium sp. GXAS 041]|uniref:glycosyltransferase n=1 Tax=Salinimicrobium sp. GXAS 041 TaxID=3400806 RepID=UPI003C7641A6